MSVSRQIKIPTPHYVVFYNGTERKEQEFIQKLSEAFEDESEGCIELVVKTININYGYNKELMGRCKSLADYSYFVAKIRKNLEKLPLQESVELAVEVCIEKDILREFLLEQKSEVIAMSIYEYNEEYVRKALFEDGVEKGYNDAKEYGVKSVIETCKEVGLKREETLYKIENKFELSKEDAEKYLLKYWINN